MFTMTCSSCSFTYEAPTEDDAETAAFAHCRSSPEHRITCSRPAHVPSGLITVIVFSAEGTLTQQTAQTPGGTLMSASSEVDHRAQRLYDRLTQVSARALSEVKGPGNSRLEFWKVGETVVVIQFYKQGGWEIYAPVSPSLAVDDNFAALDSIRLQ